MTPLLDSVTQGLKSCQITCADIAALIPQNQFWKWKDMWSFSLRNAVFSATMVEYLRSGKLLSLAQVSEILGSACLAAAPCANVMSCSHEFVAVIVKSEWKDRFTLPAEDYLHGLISLVNELVSDYITRLRAFCEFQA